MNEKTLLWLRDRDPSRLRFIVTISRVELDKEFTQCKAYWSVLAPTGKEDAAQRASAEVLARATGFCQREIGAVLHTRAVPRLQFVFDEGIGGAIRMQELLKELNPQPEHSDDTDGAPPPAEPGEPPQP